MKDIRNIYIICIICFSLLEGQSLFSPLFPQGNNIIENINIDSLQKFMENEKEFMKQEEIDAKDLLLEKNNQEMERIYTADKNVNQIQKPSNDTENFEQPRYENENLRKISDEINETFLKMKSDSIKNIVSDIQSKKEYFGYNTFFGNPEVFQPSITEPLDPSYIIGPGDEVIVMLWGDTELRNSYIVSRDGYLFIKNVGQVFVNGLTLTKLEKKLFNLLKKVYSSLGSSSGSANTYLDVSLGSSSLRPLRIFALGDINQPGAYTMKPTTTIFTSLYYFNGPKIDGSLRAIKLIRNKEEISEIDFYDFLLNGKRISDQKLQRDDIIFITPRGKSITVRGEINRTNLIFELKGNEGIFDLIKIAGGLKATTYMKRVSIDRTIPFEQRSSQGMNTTRIDLSLEEILLNKTNFTLHDQDVVTFYKINPKKKNIVSISGSVQRPGEYSLGNGLKLFDLILKADSLLENTYLDRAEIIRTRPQGEKEIINVDLTKVLADKKSKDNIQLVSNDELRVYNLDELSFYSDISITGYVLNPGIKTYYEGMRLFDLVFMGGGFNNNQRLSNTFFERADLMSKNVKGEVVNIIPFRLDSVLAGKGIADKIINRGDEIRIYSIDEIYDSKPNSVTVSGFVKRPGIYPITDESSFRDLLFRAGGFEDKENLMKIYLPRADIIRVDKDLFTKNIIKVDLSKILNEESDYSPKLEAGDLLRVYSKLDFLRGNNIEISGIINSPGIYELKNGMTLKDLIVEAGGVSSELYKYKAEISRVDFNKSDPDKWSVIYNVDLDNDLSIFGDSKGNSFNLNAYDKVILRPDPSFKKQESVIIEGSVYYPGEYVLEGPKTLPNEIVKRAGGLLPSAYPRASKFTRDGEEIRISFDKLLRNKNTRENFYLRPGDVISIGDYPNVVRLTGAVNQPGVYPFIRGDNLNDYVERAGGYKKEAARFQAFIVYPDGTSKSNDLLQLFSLKVYDGSEIIIPNKVVTDRFVFTQYAASLTTLWADVTQAWLMINLAIRK